jgi:tryptophan 2,3-dioxygenase
MSDTEATDAKPSEYEKYIRTAALLSQQKTADELVCHDELAFQIIHQVEELWMKLVMHELAQATRMMHEDRAVEARDTFHRAYLLMDMMGRQMRILETMSPKAYFVVRAALGRGSGMESPGFNQILACPPPIREALKALLERRSTDLLSLHRDPTAIPELYTLTESMIDFDEAFQTFRYLHLALVRRIIGGRTPSLKGAPAELLEHGIKKALFPELWLVREALFRDFVPGPSLHGTDEALRGH